MSTGAHIHVTVSAARQVILTVYPGRVIHHAGRVCGKLSASIYIIRQEVRPVSVLNMVAIDS